MAKPCAVFWDIQNVGVPRGQTVDSIVNLIRSTIIKPYNLNEIFFFCVCDVHKLPSNIGHSLTNLDVDIVQAYNGIKDSADIKILDLMRKFVKLAGQDCSIILLSGDGDYYGTLSELKKLHNVAIHLVRLVNSFSPKLDKISDYTFMLLNNGVLKSIKSTGLPTYFISIKNYPLTMDINNVMTTLNSRTTGSIESSAILFNGLICIGFPSLWYAERAIEQLNGSRFYGTFLKVELIVDSPLTEILKCIKPNVTMLTKRSEVKQLTFIKMNNSNETDTTKIIKFCVACTSPAGSQCILLRKLYLWIVFSFKSDAQKCLSKVKISYPDAVISEPPIDLTYTCHKNPYTVESCRQKVMEETGSGGNDSNKAASKPEKNMVVLSQNQSYSNRSYAGTGIKPKEFNESSNLEKATKAESRNVTSLDVRDDKDWKLFFRYDSNSVAPVLTKWSLLYNLFEKLYDLGAKKVIFDGNVYCAHFDSASAYQDASKEVHSLYLEPLEFVHSSEICNKQEVKKKMSRYKHGIPWCLTQELDICCLVVKISSRLHDHFIEISKYILGNRECIFIKSTPGKICIGFPDEIVCVNSAITVLRFLASLKVQNDVSTDKPSSKLLESIDFDDLVGDAYDLAFLSGQLESSKPIRTPQVIQEISMQLITKKQARNEPVVYINVKGNFRKRMYWIELSTAKIVKIFVKLSKVIPLAATASYDEVNLIYNSWHEAHAASHFINNLTSAEVPYFTELNRVNEVQQQQLAFPSIFEYYVINDKRKVLEKIVQNENPVDRLDSDLSKVQSSSKVFSLLSVIINQVKYIFAITTSSDFKFTSGMISIIQMNLLLMDCPANIEFDDQVWVGVDDLGKGNKAKARIEKIKFKILHEKDEDDFDIGVVMQLVPSSSPNVVDMLANKLMNTTETNAKNTYSVSNVVPLGHFNYSYKKAVGMTSSEYCKLNQSV